MKEKQKKLKVDKLSQNQQNEINKSLKESVETKKQLLINLVCPCGNKLIVKKANFDLNLVGVLQFKCLKCNRVFNQSIGKLWV